MGFVLVCLLQVAFMIVYLEFVCMSPTCWLICYTLVRWFVFIWLFFVGLLLLSCFDLVTLIWFDCCIYVYFCLGV